MSESNPCGTLVDGYCPVHGVNHETGDHTAPWENEEDHGPGCDGPLNCTCPPEPTCSTPEGNESVWIDTGGPESGPGPLEETTAHQHAIETLGRCPHCGEQGETEECPEHGPQPVVGSGSFGPVHDPYGASKLACGHYVGAFGAGDPLMIVKVHRS